MQRQLTACLAGLMALGLCFNPSATAQTNSKALLHGKQLAERDCSGCHAVDLDSQSPNENAPPFWGITTHRSVESIAKMLIDQAGPKHELMPKFKVTAKQANDIALWIAWVQPVARGRRIVEANCTRCHAIEKGEKGAHPDAPNFAEIANRFTYDALSEAFSADIRSGHPDMPVFEASLNQRQDLIEFILSLNSGSGQP
ncbi:MAG: cytochrome c [Pseudomonadota bacterium]